MRRGFNYCLNSHCVLQRPLNMVDTKSHLRGLYRNYNMCVLTDYKLYCFDKFIWMYFDNILIIF